MSDLNVALILRFIDQATGPARAALRNVQGAAERVERFGRTQVAQGRAMVEQSGAQIAALRGQALAVAGVGYAAYAMLRPAMQFEQAMARVGAVSNASAEEQELMTRAARELGATTNFSARQAAEGMSFLAMAGFDVNETLTAMPGLLNLASAAGSDLGRTSDIASNVLSGFNLEADQMGRLGDVLTNTFTSSNTTLEMLGATMSYVGPAAAAASIGLEQTAAMAGLLGNNGIQGERAGTALRSVLSRLAAPSNEAAEALARLNVQVSDDQGNLRDIPTVLAEMDRAMQGMGSSTRQELLTAIFGLETATAAQVLMTEAGTGALQDYAGELRETGSAARVAEQMNDTAQGAIRRLASAAEEAQIALGNGTLPVLSDLAERMIPVIAASGQWLEANQELVTSIAWVAAGLLGMNVAMLAAKAGFWLLFGWIGKARIALGAFLIVAGSITSWASILGRAVLPWLGLAFLTLKAAAVALGGALIAISAPVWAAIAAAVAAVSAVAFSLWKYWDRVSAVFSGVARRIHEELQPALEWIASAAAPILEAFTPLVAWMQDTFAPVILAFSSGWNVARTAVSSFGGWLGSFFEREILTEGQRAAFELAGHDFTDRLIGGIRSGFASVRDAGVAMIQSLWDGAAARFEAFLEWVRGIPGRIVGAIGSIDLSSVVGFGGAPSGTSSDPNERAAAAVRGQSLGYGSEVTPSSGARATGGVVRPLGWYRINEQGEELFSPAMAGRIIPAGETRRLSSAIGRAGGGSVQIGDIHVHAAAGSDPLATAREVRRQIEEMLNDARYALNDGGLYA